MYPNRLKKMKIQFDREIRRPLLLGVGLLTLYVLWMVAGPLPDNDLSRIADESTKNLCILSIQLHGEDSQDAKENCEGVHLNLVDRKNAGLE